MPITCQHKALHGTQVCTDGCPAAHVRDGVFRYDRVEKGATGPEGDPRIVDVAVLDMNHGWPNLGHDCVVHAVLDAVCDLQLQLRERGMGVRAISYDVRRGSPLPQAPGERFRVYVGTGGPGHLDPRLNDGSSPWCQGVDEDPSWEAPFFRLLDDIAADDRAAFIGICHSFGLLCRWSGVAEPVLRGSAKGGKSSGLLENWLDPSAAQHPWLRRFSAELYDGRLHAVVDNRLFDLLPVPGGSERALALAHEDFDGRPGDALTMAEFARDQGGTMPRLFGINHHPEVVDEQRQLLILNQKLERGQVTREWYEERRQVLDKVYVDRNRGRRVHLTSDYTLLLPLRFFVQREVRLRAAALGTPVDFHEDQILDASFVPTPLVGAARP